MDTRLTDDPLHPGTAREADTIRTALAASGLAAAPARESRGVPQQSEALTEMPDGLDPSSPLATLLTMWQLGKPVDRRAAGAALGVDADRVVELGLVRQTTNEMVEAEAVIVAHDGIWLACDSSKVRKGQGMADNFVLPVGGSSLALAGCVPRQSFGAALDIGTGCGIQALLLARQSGRVVGTDVNRRALSMARFNAWLNGIDNVEFREGSLYEPVMGEEFDLVVANPPFVVSPESTLLYRDGQGGSDEMSQDVISGAGDRLRPGGLGVFMVNWAIRDGDPVFDRPKSWVTGTGVDAVVVVNATNPGEIYAREWLGMNSDTVDAAEVERWTAHYRKLNIAAIATGLIVLRRPLTERREPWFAPYTAPLIRSPRKADHFCQLIALQDFLHDKAGDETDPKALLARALRPVAGHELTKTSVWRDGAYHVSKAGARIGVGFPFSGSLELGSADLLERCDGHRTLGDVISSLAADLDTDVEEMTREALPSVRKMLYLGLLLPPDVPDVPPEPFIDAQSCL